MSTRSLRGVRVVRFADFELDLRAGELSRGESRIRLQDQPRRILAMLLEHPGEVVLREEICQRLWPNGTVVEVSHGINAAVLRLRDALGDAADNPRFVETVARRGYRFCAPVEVDCRPAAPVEPATAPGALRTESLAGQTISHFRVEEMLGSGGMGVVYRAEDLSLGRMVALKFLSAGKADDAAAVSRFRREARMASALNHPNICTVHAVEECDGQPAIVMELLEGRTLEAMLAAGPMAVETALPLAIQMAAALDAAHRRQIVHRDLKPGNVMVMGRTGASGFVKVLDFGLAKQGAGGGRPGPDVTQGDSIAGTPGYMAPERFQGGEADARSDLYSLGLVLLEMLTGSRAAVDLPRLLPGAASDLGPVLRRALEANPEERWQTARDFQAALEWAAASRAAQPAGPGEPQPRPRRGVSFSGWKAAGVGLAAAILAFAGLSYWKDSRKTAAAPPAAPPPASRPLQAAGEPQPTAPPAAKAAVTILHQDEPRAAGAQNIPAAFTHGFALPAAASIIFGRMNLSPDGKRIAYGVAGQVWVRPIDGGDARMVSSGTFVAGTPFWSPDGRSLAFTRGGKLWTVSSEGGLSQAIGEPNTQLAGAWGPDGTILIGVIDGGLVGIPAGGGPSRLVTIPDGSRGETRHLLPQFLPDGRKFLYTAGSNRAGEGTLYIGSLDTPGRKAVAQIDSGAVFVPRAGSRGYLVFAQHGYLMAQAFDSATESVSGEAILIAGPVSSTIASRATATSIPEFSATRSTLVYRAAPGGRGRGQVIPVTLRSAGVPFDAGGGMSLVLMKNWMDRLPH